MADFDDRSITQAVLDAFEATPDPRLKAIVGALTRHLHAFVREADPTFEEWAQAIGFLTRVGRMCDGARQEFILLSDALGVSMLVDALAHGQRDGATETTVLGPFYVDDPPAYPQGADLTGGMAGEPLYVDVEIRGPGGAPVAGATVDVWQSDSEGFYDVQHDDKGGESFLRGRLTSDAEGRVRFWSNLPVPYPIPYDGPVGDLLTATGRHPWRPAHLHFKIAGEGFETLVTHLFVEGSPYLDSDAVFGVKGALICDFPRREPGTAPDGRVLAQPWRLLTYRFGLKPA